MLTISSKVVLFLTLFLGVNSCSAQQENKFPLEYIYGDWECVKIDKKGYQRYTWEQALELKAAILTVEKNKFYYNHISFVDSCSFYHWKTFKYDTISLSGNTLDFKYKKKVLSGINVLAPVNDKGELDCFNNCAEFYLKGDTLINVCGGYTLFLLKVKSKERELSFKEFNGTGDFKQKIDLNSCNTGIKIEYNFYNVADKIILEDANGNTLFSTGEETTNGMKTITTDVKLTDKEQCYFYLKVESSQKEKSKWELKVTLSEY